MKENHCKLVISNIKEWICTSQNVDKCKFNKHGDKKQNYCNHRCENKFCSSPEAREEADVLCSFCGEVIPRWKYNHNALYHPCFRK